MFPLTHRVVDFEQQAAYVSSRIRATVKAWYTRKPVSKEIEEAFVQGIETELMACSAIVGWSVMGGRPCGLPTFAHRLLLQRHFEIESRVGHGDIRGVRIWPTEQAEDLCHANPTDMDFELPYYTYAWWRLDFPPAVETRLIYSAYDEDSHQMRPIDSLPIPTDMVLPQLENMLRYTKTALQFIDDQIEEDEGILKKLEQRAWVVENMARWSEMLDLRIEEGMESALLAFPSYMHRAP